MWNKPERAEDAVELERKYIHEAKLSLRSSRHIVGVLSFTQTFLIIVVIFWFLLSVSEILFHSLFPITCFVTLKQMLLHSLKRATVYVCHTLCLFPGPVEL
jgi:hypothetical protein